MFRNSLSAVAVTLPRFELTGHAAREHHCGAEVYVTRKGAIRAGVGDLGIIPGSLSPCLAVDPSQAGRAGDRPRAAALAETAQDIVR